MRAIAAPRAGLRPSAVLFASLLLTGAVACGDDDTPPIAPDGPDAAVVDLGRDAGLPDLGSADAQAAVDVGPFDLGAGDAADAGVDTGPPPSERPTIYYVIRHTERDPGEDPPINAEGQARAQRLADALARAGIEEIVTTRFIRGQQSGQPLSLRTGAPITVAPAQWTGWVDFGNQVGTWQRAREVPGRTYLMIGHSGGYNSELLRNLGASFDGLLGERYQDMVILVRERDGTVRLSLLEYGGRSSLDL